MIYVLDASALLRFTDKEPGFDRIRELLRLAAQGDLELFLSAVNWGEIVTVLYKKHDLAETWRIANKLKALPITIAPVGVSIAESAATFKHDFKIPYVDAIAAALTRELSSGSPKEWATLVTADFDFKNLPTASIQIEYLPAKKKVPTKQART